MTAAPVVAHDSLPPGAMDDDRARRRAALAGLASMLALATGVALCSLAGVDDPTMSDSAIAYRVHENGRQVAAGIGLPLIGAGVALLLWFASGLRCTLERLSGGDPRTHVIVPAAAMIGGLVITGAALDASVALTAFGTDTFTPDPDLSRVLGTAGLVIALAGLSGGTVLVAATTLTARRARAFSTWAVWASYAVATVCLSSFWSGGMASVALAVWVVGAAIWMLRLPAVTSAPPRGEGADGSTA